MDVEDRNILGLWLRNANVGESNNVTIELHLTTSVGYRELVLVTKDDTDWIESSYWMYDHIGDEVSVNDNEWHYLEFDLEERLKSFYPTATLTRVDGMTVRCKELYLDDIVLSGGRLKKTYLQTGNPLGGTLGCQAGALPGTIDRALSTNGIITTTTWGR